MRGICFLTLLVGCVIDGEPKDSTSDSGETGVDTDSGVDTSGDRAMDLLREGCGPDDGLTPVVEVGLNGDACDATPLATDLWVRIMFNQMDGPATAGTSYDLADGGVSVWVYPTGGTDYVIPSVGTVMLDGYTYESEARGSFDVTLSDGSSFAGPFWASWCEIEHDPCG